MESSTTILGGARKRRADDLCASRRSRIDNNSDEDETDDLRDDDVDDHDHVEGYSSSDGIVYQSQTSVQQVFQRYMLELDGVFWNCENTLG